MKKKKITQCPMLSHRRGIFLLSLELMNNVDYIDNKWRRKTNNNNNNDLFISYAVAVAGIFLMEKKGERWLQFRHSSSMPMNY